MALLESAPPQTQDQNNPRLLMQGTAAQVISSCHRPRSVPTLGRCRVPAQPQARAECGIAVKTRVISTNDALTPHPHSHATRSKELKSLPPFY